MPRHFGVIYHKVITLYTVILLWLYYRLLLYFCLIFIFLLLFRCQLYLYRMKFQEILINLSPLSIFMNHPMGFIFIHNQGRHEVWVLCTNTLTVLVKSSHVLRNSYNRSDSRICVQRHLEKQKHKTKTLFEVTPPQQCLKTSILFYVLKNQTVQNGHE